MPRGVAQSGSAPGWGPGGRRFKSCLPDLRKSCKLPVLEVSDISLKSRRGTNGEQESWGLARGHTSGGCRAAMSGGSRILSWPELWSKRSWLRAPSLTPRKWLQIDLLVSRGSIPTARSDPGPVVRSALSRGFRIADCIDGLRLQHCRAWGTDGRSGRHGDYPWGASLR